MKALIALILIAAAAAHAQPYASGWTAFDAGHGSNQAGVVQHRGVFNGWLRHNLQSANYALQAAHPSLPLLIITPGAPTIYISMEKENVKVFWPMWASNYVLQECVTLVGDEWADVSGPYDNDGANWYVITEAGEKPHFFRLKR